MNPSSRTNHLSVTRLQSLAEEQGDVAVGGCFTAVLWRLTFGPVETSDPKGRTKWNPLWSCPYLVGNLTKKGKGGEIHCKTAFCGWNPKKPLNRSCPESYWNPHKSSPCPFYQGSGCLNTLTKRLRLGSCSKGAAPKPKFTRLLSLFPRAKQIRRQPA